MNQGVVDSLLQGTKAWSRLVHSPRLDNKKIKGKMSHALIVVENECVFKLTFHRHFFFRDTSKDTRQAVPQETHHNNPTFAPRGRKTVGSGC